MSEENIAIRLKLLISELGINSSVFADNCGISRATLSQLLTGRNKKISDVLISQIHKTYPSLSILWLLFNEGPMWNKDSDSSISEHKEQNTNSNSDNCGTNDTDNNVSPEQPHASIEKESNYYNSLNNGQSRESQRQVTNDQTDLIKNTSKPEEMSSTISVKDNTLELVKEIEMLRKKIRKVVQITIYYDDSTFETFYPK